MGFRSACSRLFCRNHDADYVDDNCTRHNRSIHVNPRYAQLKRRAAERLTSDEGVELRRRRATDVETVFGDVKRNWGFTRFTLRGIEKVAHEWRLLMMGHNLRKLAKALAGSGAEGAGTPARA